MWGLQSGTALEGLSEVTFTPAVADTPVRKRVAARPSVVRRVEIERHVEHEARGLLNAIGLLDRCLASVVATEFERQEWTREIQASRQRLEELYAEGLDRSFHVAQ